MKYVITYDSGGAHSHPKHFEQIKQWCEQFNIELYKASDFFDADVIKQLLDVSENGFDDIIKITYKKTVANMTYSECIRWLLEDIEERITTSLFIIYKDYRIKRFERGFQGISYFVKLLDFDKKDV